MATVDSSYLGRHLVQERGANPIKKSKSSTDHKVASIVFVIFGSLITFFIAFVAKVISDWRTKPFREKIEMVRKDHITELLNSYSHLDQPSSEQNLDPWFKSQVLLFLKKIKKLKESDLSLGSVEALYLKFQKFVADPRFDAEYTKLDKNSQTHQFLVAFATRFRTADMSQTLIEYAKKEIGPIAPDSEGRYSIGKMAEVLSNYRSQKFSFSHDAIWAISHPSAFLHSLASQDKYNSHQSNPTYCIHTTDFLGHKANFIAGPSPFNDPVYQKIVCKERAELRFNIMDTCKGKEHSWIEQLDQTIGQKDSLSKQVVFGFKTKRARGYLEKNSVDELIDEYQKAILGSDQKACRSIQDKKKDNVVLIPESLLSVEQIQDCCSQARRFLQRVSPDLNLENKATRHAVLFVVDLFLSLASTCSFSKTEANEIDLSTACKQCFDRGPTYLIGSLIFARSIQEGGNLALTEEEFYKMISLFIFRAPLHEGRAQQQQKFEVFAEFAKIIGSNSQELSAHTNTLKSKFAYL